MILNEIAVTHFSEYTNSRKLFSLHFRQYSKQSHFN